MSVTQTNLELAWNIDTVRKLLKWWGEYKREPGQGFTNLGYPNAANFLSVYFDRYRVRAPISTKPRPIVLKVEAAVELLKNVDAPSCMALVYKYHYDWTVQHSSTQMNVSEKTYKGWVLTGEYFVAGQLI